MRVIFVLGILLISFQIDSREAGDTLTVSPRRPQFNSEDRCANFAYDYKSTLETAISARVEGAKSAVSCFDGGAREKTQDCRILRGSYYSSLVQHRERLKTFYQALGHQWVAADPSTRDLKSHCLGLLDNPKKNLTSKYDRRNLKIKKKQKCRRLVKSWQEFREAEEGKYLGFKDPVWKGRDLPDIPGVAREDLEKMNAYQNSMGQYLSPQSLYRDDREMSALQPEFHRALHESRHQLSLTLREFERVTPEDVMLIYSTGGDRLESYMKIHNPENKFELQECVRTTAKMAQEARCPASLDGTPSACSRPQAHRISKDTIRYMGTLNSYDLQFVHTHGEPIKWEVGKPIGAQSVGPDDLPSSTSDKRLKTEIQPLQKNLQQLSQIQSYQYDWKPPRTQRDDIGLLAQEVEKVFPAAVETTPEGVKKVYYWKLVSPLIGAVNELNREIANLKKENQKLKEKIDSMGNKTPKSP